MGPVVQAGVDRPWPITAYGAACGLGRTTADVLAGLRAGADGLVPVGRERGLPFTSWFGFVPGELAPLPTDLVAWDTRHARLVAHGVDLVREAVEGAVARWGRERVGVVVGTTTGGMADTEARYPDWRAHGAFTDGYDLRRQHAQLATAELIATLVGATGPRISQSSACSSSNKVLGTARRLLDLGVCDAVVVGGVDSWCRFTMMGFRSLEVLTSDRCAPFAADRTGINLGEAAALLLVERDGDARALLRGVGETSDAHHMTQPHPEGSGLVAAMREALSRSGVAPEQVDLVNAHATGTRLNDTAEAAAIRAVLPHGPPVIGTKGATGHTLGACGGLEAIFTIASLAEGWAPGTRTRAPLEEGLGIDVRTEAWTGRFRYALSTTAAFAGHNAAVLLEAP